MMQYVVLGGRLRRIAIAATAGNVATSLTPGVGYRWSVLALRVTLVCDATVANRNTRVRLMSAAGTTPYQSSRVSANVTASQTKTLHLEAGPLSNVGSGSYESDVLMTHDRDAWSVEGAEQLKVDISAGVAGDSYSGTLSVLEMPA